MRVCKGKIEFSDINSHITLGSPVVRALEQYDRNLVGTCSLKVSIKANGFKLVN